MANELNPWCDEMGIRMNEDEQFRAEFHARQRIGNRPNRGSHALAGAFLGGLVSSAASGFGMSELGAIFFIIGGASIGAFLCIDKQKEYDREFNYLKNEYLRNPPL